MSPERWKQVEALFERALDVSTAERRSFLREACGGDAELHSEVEAMLTSDEVSGNFLDERDIFFSSEDWGQFAPGDRIDRYRIVREIGRGGMGAVFLAERSDDQFEQRVALKIIKRGMDSDSVLRRFRKERQILAGFDHPNIARLFDGGTTESGVPYFVMEYVEGLALDQYCRENALSLPDRLKLFREICGAVSYAHRHLVIHRDLKRSNILVTSAGVPKLLDFGIARILQQGSEPLFTVTGSAPMTPEFASPEQLRGGPVTTATDIYSLGVVLYELLTGASPYCFASGSPRDLERAITEEVPERPSTAARKTTTATGELTDRRLTIHDSRALRGDLDNIILMALRKEPERRYSSVDQFSADIRRYLESRPVLARKDTLGYRSGKFVQRNKLALAAAALVLLSFLIGIVATTREARIAIEQRTRAERRFNDVRKLANSVLFDYHDAIKSLPGATKVRERLVKDALNYLDSLAKEAHGDPALQRELAAAYERVGDVRGGESSGSLGDISGALESYTKAISIREEVLAVTPNDAQTRRDLASSHRKVGFLLRATEQRGSQIEHLRKALAIDLELAREQPLNNDLQLELAGIHSTLGNALTGDADFDNGLEQHHAALEILQKLVAGDPGNQKYRRALWTSQEKLAYALFLKGDDPAAIEINAKDRALGEALLAEDPNNADYGRLLVLSYQYAGDFLQHHDTRGALEYFQKAAALDEKLLVADPGNALTRKDLAYTHKKIADFLAELEDNSQALFHFSKAVESYERVVADSPADLVSQFLVVTCHGGVAEMQARLGELGPALEECRKANGLLQKTTGGKTAYSGRAQAYEYLGHAYAALATSPKESAGEARQHTIAARDMFRQALNILEDLRSRGTLGSNEQWASEISAEMAKCDKALAEQ